MIRSMTGFGRGDASFKDGHISVEIKTVNHKFFEATIKLPTSIAVLEDEVKEILQKKIKRGKVNLNLVYDGAISKDGAVSINKKIAKNYYDELSKLGAYIGIKNSIALKDVITLPGVLNYEVMEKGLAKLWPKIKGAIEKALRRLIKDREKEGRSIHKDLGKRAKKLGNMLVAIKSRTHINIEEHRRRFAERVKDLIGGREIDMGRLEMEVAIFAKNSDISEEIARLESHLVNFKKTITDNGEAGKKLDFIAQELHREINTIGSKSSDFQISKNVIEMKSEVEKIREQAKNVE